MNQWATLLYHGDTTESG